MSSRSRILAFVSAGVVAAAGFVCVAVVPGLVGQVLAIALISLGLGAAVLLIFLEVGLSEDRDRARDEEGRRRRDGRLKHERPPLRPQFRRRPRRPG